MSVPETPSRNKPEVKDAAADAARDGGAVTRIRATSDAILLEHNGKIYVFALENVNAEDLSDFLYNAVQSYVAYQSGKPGVGDRLLRTLIPTKKGRAKISEKRRQDFLWQLIECVYRAEIRGQKLSLENVSDAFGYTDWKTLQRQLKRLLGLTWRKFLSRYMDAGRPARTLVELRAKHDDAMRQAVSADAEEEVGKAWRTAKNTWEAIESYIRLIRVNPSE